jgi:outer membrane protein assembly factor BamB/tetratricopeptide (TPR) repeat protein
MAKTSRLFTVVAAGAFVLGALALLCTAPAEGQQVKQVIVQPGGPIMPARPGGPGGPPGQPGQGGTASQFSAIKLVEKSEYRSYIEAATDAIKDARQYLKKGRGDEASKAWNDAVTVLQTILDTKEDYYVKVHDREARTGREVERWASVKFEANNLLGSMPDEGLDVYEVRFGGKARQRLDEAKKKGDFEMVADVAQRYLHTKPGAEANDLLATWFLDRGQFFMAALRFERLLALSPKRSPPSELTLFKAALAYRRAGDLKHAADAWQRLLPRLRDKGGLPVGDQLVSLERLEKTLDRVPRPEATNPHDWTLIRGNVTNSAQANGSPPLLDEVLWRRPTILDKGEGGEVDEREQAAKTRIDAALKRNESVAGSPVMPGFFPVAVGGRLIYRTYTGLTAVLLKDVKEGDILIKAGEIDWKTTDFDGALAVVLGDKDLRPSVEGWLNMYAGQPGTSGLLYENSMVGTLSSDHRNVYAVDDLAIPAHPQVVRTWQFNGGQVSPQVKRLVTQNGLRAYDLQTGKEVWSLGGSPKATNNAHKDDFQDSHFLGAPLPVGGKLYVLNEKSNGELFLVCLDAATGSAIGPLQMLGTIDQNARIVYDISRRTNAVHLGYGEGILVCPTNAGEILGVDLLSRTLAWAYPYREKSPHQDVVNPFPGRPIVIGPGGMPNTPVTLGNWYNAPPVIADGKVVFTAPDASSVHCINLRDGTPCWKRPQIDGDLFLAGVFDGKVLIVGKNGVRIRSLADGEQLKYLPTGDAPSGQGVASRNIYYLPLKKGEICAIDLEHGVIKAHNRATSPGGQMPGNLVFYEGTVLSQTPVELVAYPQLTARLELANAAVARDPNDLARLTTRGELRLADGQVQGAVADLRAALAKKPPADLMPRVRQKLYLALTDLFQVDFNEASAKYLDEYRELCKVPGNKEEEQNRQAKFLRLLAQGREGQHNLVEAFQAYREFGALPIHQHGEVAVNDDPTHKVPTNVWLRGRIAAMMARATPEQRRPLEEKIAQEWQAVRARNDIDAIRSFAGMFDVPFAVGRQARLELANAIIDKQDRSAYLEAELDLEQLRSGALRDDPQVGGRALEALARLEMRKGTESSLGQAAAYYRQLGHDFPKVVLRDGKTGADLLNELTTDKRFLPNLRESGPVWGSARIAARELAPGAISTGLQGFIYQPEGDLAPDMRQCRLVLDPINNNDPKLRLVDMTSNKVRWEIHLGLVNSNFQFFQFLSQQAMQNTSFHPNARFRFYQVKGHLAVLQVGTMAYGLDLENGQKLWEHSLLETAIQPGQPNMMFQQVMPDPDGNLQMIVWNQFNGQRHAIRIGHVGAVEASYVCLLKQKSLVVLDPLRGKTLWAKGDLPADTHVFGDDQHLFLVDVSGGSASGGRALRVGDGTPVEVQDFAPVYQHRVRVRGRRILAATPGREGLTLRLYDIVAGKDVWSSTFDGRSVVLHTDDPALTGVIDPAGKMTIVDAGTGKAILQASVVQGRVSADDVKGLREPLLLADPDHYYVALNRPIDPQHVMGGVVSNNFSNLLRCAQVNGWVLAFHRHDGERGEGDNVTRWKRGELHWHSYAPISNQLIILEQFEKLPVLLFSARYAESLRGGFGAQRSVSVTQSIDKRTGKMIYDPINPRISNGVAPQFFAFTIDMKEGTINMIGYQSIVQHYVDDGRKRPEAQTYLQPEGPRGAGAGVSGFGPPPGVAVPVPVQPGLRGRGGRPRLPAPPPPPPAK